MDLCEDYDKALNRSRSRQNAVSSPLLPGVVYGYRADQNIGRNATQHTSGLPKIAAPTIKEIDRDSDDGTTGFEKRSRGQSCRRRRVAQIILRDVTRRNGNIRLRTEIRDHQSGRRLADPPGSATIDRDVIRSIPVIIARHRNIG